MSVDVFGHHLTHDKTRPIGRRGPTGEAFKITVDGQYDMNNKRLCHIADPTEEPDAVPPGAMQRELKKLHDTIHTNARIVHRLIGRVKTLEREGPHFTENKS